MIYLSLGKGKDMQISLPFPVSPAHTGILHLPVLCNTQHWWVMKSQVLTSCVCTRERSDLEREPSLKIAAERMQEGDRLREREKNRQLSCDLAVGGIDWRPKSSHINGGRT